MFIITQNLNIKTSIDFTSFDILTDPVGIPIKFDSMTEAIRFLASMGLENDWNSSYIDEGGIKIDRLH